MKPYGGGTSELIPPSRPVRYGSKRIRWRQLHIGCLLMAQILQSRIITPVCNLRAALLLLNR
jgi:hypothetical protein